MRRKSDNTVPVLEGEKHMASKVNKVTKGPVSKVVAKESKPAAKEMAKEAGKEAAKPAAKAAAKAAPAGASAKNDNGSAKTVEAKLVRLMGLTDEAQAEKILGLLKTHGLNKSQVVALVEAIRREEQEIIFGEQVMRGDLQTNPEDLMDEADLASSDIEQGMKMRMANRENFKVKRLHKSLDKIKDGTYGECESCSADIGFARLSARPIAELCIACKEEEERKENLSAVGRKPKSMGQGLGQKLSAN